MGFFFGGGASTWNRLRFAREERLRLGKIQRKKRQMEKESLRNQKMMWSE